MYIHFIVQNFFLVHGSQTPLNSNKPYYLSFSHQLVRLCPKEIESLKVTNQLPPRSWLAIPDSVFIGKEKSEPCARSPKCQDADDIAVSCDPECFAALVRLFTSLQTRSLQMHQRKWKPTKFLSACHYIPTWKTRKKTWW